MDWNSLQTSDLSSAPGRPRYERLAEILIEAITQRQLRSGERLPTARELSRIFSVSATTVSSAFAMIERQGLIRAEVGRGTFVDFDGSRGRTPRTATSPGFGVTAQPHTRTAWRRGTLMTLGGRLRTTYPDALECGTGRPDLALLPFDLVKEAWAKAIEETVSRDLQYAGPEPIPALADILQQRLERDGVHVSPHDLLVCSSAQQVFALVLNLLSLEHPSQPLLIGVEEPGYPTVMDTFERAGAHLVGLAMDHEGVRPESLEAALTAGIHAMLFTPRGQNPTGASWTPARCTELASVLARYPKVMILEDDQVAEVASEPVGSLLNDARLEQRVIYIRSFSKCIAPDLRVAAVAAKGLLLQQLTEAKAMADGWTSHLLQRTLSIVLADSRLEDVMENARSEYRKRREAAAEAIQTQLTPFHCGTWCGPDGLNLWVELPPDSDARDVVERCAAGGVRLADGEAFYVSLGHRNTIRLNAGSVPVDQARQAGSILATSIISSFTRRGGPIQV